MLSRRILGSRRIFQKSLAYTLIIEHANKKKTYNSVLRYQACGIATYKIREATTLDAETIRHMLQEQIANEDKTWTQDIVPQDEFNECCFGGQRSLHPFVAEHWPVSKNDDTGKTIVGCIIFSQITDYYFGNQAYLQGLTIKPEHRGSGIANRLFAAVIEYGLKHGCKTGFALTKRDNRPAQKLVEGFNGKVFMEDYCMMQMNDLDRVIQDYDVSGESS